MKTEFIRNENIYQIIEKNKKAGGMTFVYGCRFAEVLCANSPFEFDYFVDKRADELCSIHGIKVITIDQLKKMTEKSNQKSIIIIVESFANSSIYTDIMKNDINAYVCDYMYDNFIFSCNSFTFRGKEYKLFEHIYNCGYTKGRMTERAVEISLAKKFVENFHEDIVEVGAVTPYYFNSDKIKEIIDPADESPTVTSKLSVIDCDLQGKNVLSISTIEHIGVGDYGFEEKNTAIDGMNKVLKESKSCFITVPVGQNKLLDEWIKDNRTSQEFDITILYRSVNNYWTELKTEENIFVPYCAAAANTLAVITKNLEI